MPPVANSTRFWDKAAKKYAAAPIADMAGYETSLERTRHYLRPDDRILELGCGTGTTALRLAPDIAHSLATDISSQMIAIARDKAAAEGCRTVSFEVASLAQATLLPNGAARQFDAVLAFNLLHLIDGLQEALDNIRASLKPGRLFISKTPCLSEMTLAIRAFIPLAQLVGKAPLLTYFTARQLEDQIARAGFQIVERARHGTKRSDPRIFLVGRKT